MKAAVVNQVGEAPVYQEFAFPVSDGSSQVVSVLASALTNLDIITAEGRHYFSPTTGPFVAGKEAVARDADGNRHFYNVHAMVFPYGSMAQHALVRPEYGLSVPDCVSDAQAAALGNAGLAAWLALSWRARLQAGETVLILGATGASGLIAVAAAKLLGAGRVIAAGRNRQALDHAQRLGADAVVQLDGVDDLESAFRAACGASVDIVIDYLNGPPAAAALAVMGVGGRMVQIGSPLAPVTLVPAQLARRNSLDVLGFAYYHAPIAEQALAYRLLCEHAAAGRIDLAFSTRPLDEIGLVWAEQKAGGSGRIVLIP